MTEGSILLAAEQHPGDAVDVATLRFARGPKGLRLFVGEERCYLLVKLRLADPVQHPDRYVSVLDSKEREICLLDTLEGLEASSREVIEQELARYYVVPTVERVLDLSLKHGPLYWRVATDRGPREFVVKWSSDTVLYLPDGGLRLTDVDGNRFLLPPSERLDATSRKRVELLR